MNTDENEAATRWLWLPGEHQVRLLLPRSALICVNLRFVLCLEAVVSAALLCDQLLQLPDVCRELPDTFRGFFGRHGILVEREAEGLLIEGHLLEIGARGTGGVELAFDGRVGGLQFTEESGGDREQIAARELDDFTGIAEARTHDL